MKTRFAFFLAGAVSLLSAASSAENATFVDLRERIYHGKVTKILTPTTVAIQIKRDGRKETLELRLADIVPGNGADGQCHGVTKPTSYIKHNGPLPNRKDNPNSKLRHACKVLSKTIKGETVGIEISQWDYPTTGYLSLKGSIVNFDLISNGEYRVDYSQSRSAHLVRLEKKARCSRVGTWTEMYGDVIEDMKCQE